MNNLMLYCEESDSDYLELEEAKWSGNLLVNVKYKDKGDIFYIDLSPEKVEKMVDYLKKYLMTEAEWSSHVEREKALRHQRRMKLTKRECGCQNGCTGGDRMDCSEVSCK